MTTASLSAEHVNGHQCRPETEVMQITDRRSRKRHRSDSWQYTLYENKGFVAFVFFLFSLLGFCRAIYDSEATDFRQPTVK